MAKQQQPEAEKKPAAPTRRVVIKRERVVVIPDGVDVDAKKVAAALGIKDVGDLVISEDAWRVLGNGEGSKLQAIQEHAGVAGTPDAIPGEYRAPSESSWREGQRYAAPPAPLVERSEID